MTAGAFAPASPIVTNSVNGFISGNLLTVTSVTLGATFTGQLSNQVTAKIDNGSGSAGNILTVTAPTAVQFVSIPIGPQLAPGMTISNVAGTITGSPTIVSQLTSASTPALGQPGLAGTYLISGSPQLVASGTVQGTVSSGPPPGPPQDLNVSGVTGTLLATMIVTDSGAHIGPLSPLQTTSFSAALATVLPRSTIAIDRAPETMYGTTSSVIPGQSIRASGITTPVSITGVQAMTPCPTGFPLCGTYTLSNSANTVVI